MKCSDKEQRCSWEKEEKTETVCIPIGEKVNKEKSEKRKSRSIFEEIKKENKKVKSCNQVEEEEAKIIEIEPEQCHPKKIQHVVNPQIQQSFCPSSKIQNSQISIRKIDASSENTKEEQEDIIFKKKQKKCSGKKKRKLPVKVVKEEDCNPKIEEEEEEVVVIKPEAPVHDILIAPTNKGLRKNPQFHNLVKEMQGKLPQLFREDMQLLKVGGACCFENPCIRDDELDFWKWLFGQSPFELGIRKLLETAQKHLDNTVIGELINRVQHPEEYMMNENGEVVRTQNIKRSQKQKAGRSFQVEISQEAPQKIKSRNSCNVSRTTISVHFDSCDEDDDEDEECEDSHHQDSDTNEDHLEEKKSRSRSSLKIAVRNNSDCRTDYAEERKMDHNDSIKRRQKIILQQQAALLKQQLCLQQGGNMTQEEFDRNFEMQCKALEQQITLQKQLCGSTIDGGHQPRPSSQREPSNKKMNDSMQMRIEVENGKDCVVKTPAVSMKRRVSTSGRFEELQFSPQQQIEKNRERLKQFRQQNEINSNFLEESRSKERCEEHYNAITDLISKLKKRDI